MSPNFRKIILVAGARPNFMKIAPILNAFGAHNRAFPERPFVPILVHTGQHYDANMSDSFFVDLGIRKPDYHLECGGGTHAEQTAKIMVEFERLCERERPDMVLVVGDVNSTIAAGLVAKKMDALLIHVEAGLRSGDRRMPEEINRLATDAITDIFFTTEPEGGRNLLAEGHLGSAIHFVGHVMIDNLFRQLEKLADHVPSPAIAALRGKLPKTYFCMTLHRPSNVDDPVVLERLLTAIHEIGKTVPVVFPCHPRTRKRIKEFGLDRLVTSAAANCETTGIFLLEPLGYNDFLLLWKDSTAVLTDSGGLQEETTALGIPCVTLRENTERPITVSEGSNVLVGTDPEKLKDEVRRILGGQFPEGRIPEKWDGKAGERIVAVLDKVVPPRRE